MKLETIKAKAKLLTAKEKRELIMYLRNSYSIFEKYAEATVCPDCNSEHIVKNGTRNGSHKYICRECKKNFTYRTNTVLSGIQKLNKWNMFVEDFMSLNITPLNELKEKLGVSKQTVFNWRHKLLSVLTKKEPKFNNEIVEFDESNFLISRKGRQDMKTPNKTAYKYWRKNQVGDSDYNVKVFLTYGRNSKSLDLHQSNMGRTSKKDLERYFTSDRFKNITIYSDKHPTYKSYFKANEIDHDTFLSKDHVNWENREVHNQTVNAYAKGFKDFVNSHLKGVSSKYIISYLKWYQFIYETKLEIKKQLKTNKKVKFNITDNICKEVVKDGIGLGIYRQLEYSYEMFLKQNGRTNFGKCKNHYYKSKIAC